MKKLILAGAALALFSTAIISCGENKDAKTEEATTTTTTTTTEPTQTTETAPTTTAATDAPTFSSEEVNKGLAEYKTLMDEYMKAIESKDQAKIAELGQKYATWSQGAGSWATKLKPEEAQKFSEYMQTLSKQWTDAAAKAAAH
ncbi:hypothetical protein [Taibaiella koreensis]|uniref:hypothetical protein n=1 Tax=Taibaiella koreensis TaxID=1268548 RepID=UPI000E59A688|nr:hypothetical protein [Taibaiella koreensis]